MAVAAKFMSWALNRFQELEELVLAAEKAKINRRQQNLRISKYQDS